MVLYRLFISGYEVKHQSFPSAFPAYFNILFQWPLVIWLSVKFPGVGYHATPRIDNEGKCPTYVPGGGGWALLQLTDAK